MRKCKSFKKYKGIHKPRCNEGEGCYACNKKYTIEHCDHSVDKLKIGGCANPYDPSCGHYALHCTDCGEIFFDSAHVLLKHIQKLTAFALESERAEKEIIWRVDVT